MRIGSVLLLKKQKCVQSYCWNKFRPLGSLQLAVDALEEYECDEIAIIRPVRAKDCLDSFRRDIEFIKSLKTMTPISFGGGIRTFEHLELLKDMPIERLILSSSFIKKDEFLINKARSILGKQAIQCLLPIKYTDQKIWVYKSYQENFCSIDQLDMDFVDRLANEIILYDTEGDGCRDAFNRELLGKFSLATGKLVLTGGMGDLTANWAKKLGIASILIDNKTLHKEYSIKGYKNA